jgi:hypothetical protein
MAELYEFNSPGWLARVRATPLGDALRGVWSGRLDPRNVIAAAELPAPLANLIYTVIRRSRLWRREQADVARELVAHFADGLAAGRSAEDLARAFGSPKEAAQLIRRAKRRNRPLLWHAWHFLTRSALAALLVGLVAYVCFTVRFYLGRPDIAHNYWNEINAARQINEGDRAWPLYREALVKLGNQNWIDVDKVAQGPSGKEWNEVVTLLERHRDALDLVRRGAGKPRLGFYLGDSTDISGIRNAHADWLISQDTPMADENHELISALVYAAQSCRTIARLLVIDARVAASAGDGMRVMADLMALVSLSEQQFEPDAMLVEQMVGLAMHNIAADEAGRILADKPAVLDDKQLLDLAHRLAAYRNGQMPIDFSGEQLLFDDILQRVYTDDGRGNGRITPSGIKLLLDWTTLRDGLLGQLNAIEKEDRRAAALSGFVTPGLAALVGSREENRDFYRSMLHRMIVVHQGPRWQWDQQAIDAYKTQLLDLAAPTHQIASAKLRYYFVAAMLPGIEGVFTTVERAIQVRDAVQVAIALELWHRRHGAWPERLDQLVPELLPSVPADRVDGQPLRYTTRDGHPLLYSVGEDGRDDGGRPAQNPANVFEPAGPAGDWILWPPLPEEPPIPE